MNRTLRTVAASATFAALFVLASCSSTGDGGGAPPAVVKDARGANYLKDGPTLRLDEASRAADPTTLEMIEQAKGEVAKLKRQVDDLQMEATTRAADNKKLQEELVAHTKDKDRLESLLTESTERERAALEQAMTAEISRLKCEQELLKSKLAGLVRDGAKH